MRLSDSACLPLRYGTGPRAFDREGPTQALASRRGPGAHTDKGTARRVARAARTSAQRSRRVAKFALASCNMKTLYLRNVPDDVVRRLQRLAEADATSVGAVAVRELTEVSRRADNPGLLSQLADLSVDAAPIVDDLDTERARR